MKRLWTLMAMVAVFASCSQEETDSHFNTYTLTGYTDVESRTAFGTQSGNKIPFLWSADDKIYVDDKCSESIAISNDEKSATFTFNNPPSGTNVYYNMTCSPTSPNKAIVKTSQTVGNLGKNGDFGYGTINNGSFTLKHATSYVWFDTILPDGAELETITLDAGNTTIAGVATWDQGEFGTISNAGSSITLTVNKSSINGAELAMVIFPTTFNDASVTYQMKINDETKYYKKTINETKEVPAGKTWKITTDLTGVELKDLKVLTFEDKDAKFSPYELDYVGANITTWSDLIDEPQYGGPLTYGTSMLDAEYTWYDEGNTELMHMFPYNSGYCYWSGGHAISNYCGAGYTNEDRNKYIAKYYGDTYVDQWAGNDQMLGWFNLQFMTPICAHSGDNFAVHYGYIDDFNGFMMQNLPEISFQDETPRVIDHMYVTNTNYTLNQLVCGVGSEAGNTFGGSWTGLTDDAWLKIVAYGYDSFNADPTSDEPTSTAEFYLVKGNNVVETWQKWDLSRLGKVAKVRFNFLYSDAMGGSYGFTIPGYFAYDDVAVRFE